MAGFLMGGGSDAVGRVSQCVNGGGQWRLLIMFDHTLYAGVLGGVDCQYGCRVSHAGNGEACLCDGSGRSQRRKNNLGGCF